VIHFAAARNPAAATFVTLLALIFTIITVFLPGSGAPMIIPIGFGLVALIADIGAINSWLSSSTVTSRPGCLTLTRGLPLLRHQREMPAGTVSDIAVSTSSQVLGVNYYSLSAITNGRTIRLASGIRGKEIAERLADELKQTIGVNAAV
jgi:hypothetical protein